MAGPKPSSDLRERLIDAVERCFEHKGVATTTMLDVAREACVSRTSLYKHFSSMESLLQAAFMREFDHFEVKLAPRLARCDTAEDQLLEVVIGIAENVPKNAAIGSLVKRPRTKTEEQALRVGRDALDHRVKRMIDAPLDQLQAEGRLRVDTPRPLLVEWIRTLVHAFSALRHPQQRSQIERRRLIRAFLLPSITDP